jgi:fatty-acid peroxygenase
LAADLVALVDGFGSPSPRFARAASARLRTGRWAARLVRSVRAGEIAVKDDTVLGRLAGLDVRPEIAGVEVLNVLRPTVAVSWFVEFAAVELERQPQLRAALADDESLRESFAHELRRVYPFVPVLGARAQRAFEVCGQPVRPRDRVVLDVYGTLHDPALWPEPERFRAERFVDLEPDPFALIPQGGGRPDGHRCPGERLTIELIKVAASWLARVPLAVVPGDHSVPLTTMPTRPIDPVVLAEVRRTS